MLEFYCTGDRCSQTLSLERFVIDKNVNYSKVEFSFTNLIVLRFVTNYKN